MVGLEHFLWLGLAILWLLVGGFTVYMGVAMKREGKRLNIFLIAFLWLLIVIVASSITAYVLPVLLSSVD